MDLNDLYSEIIKEHSSSQHNKHHLDSPTIIVPGNNPTCGDEIQLELDEQSGCIQDASFTGFGCAISQASSSIMIDLVRGKTVDEARALAELFLAMSRREELSDEELEKLEEAAALKNVANMPARVKCATMPWHTLLKALEPYEAITEDSSIQKVLTQYPWAEAIFQRHGMQCVGCIAAKFETIGQGARAHSIDTAALLDELNQLLKEKLLG